MELGGAEENIWCDKVEEWRSRKVKKVKGRRKRMEEERRRKWRQCGASTTVDPAEC